MLNGSFRVLEVVSKVKVIRCLINFKQRVKIKYFHIANEMIVKNF